MPKKESYTVYKVENRAEKNKIKKLERHCKRFPDDKEGKKNLERIKKDGYKPRSKPLSPGSNPTIEKVVFRPNNIKHPETAGEQLSRLLGIPFSKTKKPIKSKIIVKQKRNVK